MSVGGQLPGLELAANIRCRLGSPRKWTVRCSTCSRETRKSNMDRRFVQCSRHEHCGCRLHRGIRVGDTRQEACTCVDKNMLCHLMLDLSPGLSHRTVPS